MHRRVPGEALGFVLSVKLDPRRAASLRCPSASRDAGDDDATTMTRRSRTWCGAANKSTR
jgi:hypothetical protein